jgi:adenine-specific DNA-methyltransferase
LIKYLGSKKKLLAQINEVIGSFGDVKSVGDMFSGTSRVGHSLKQNGYRVVSNDHNSYAHALATCYVQSDTEDWQRGAELLVEEFNSLQGEPGYFTKTFCEDARYFQPKNGARVDAIREAIETKDLHPELKSIMLVSLMEAADRVDSTTGVQMAYLKQWATRANNDLSLRVPNILPRAKAGKGQALQMDALDAVRQSEVDLLYLDPPYNQHSYLGNYHIWESLVLWDKPEVYGVANKRVDVRDRKSTYNFKREFHSSFRELLQAVDSKIAVISFNNEGYISKSEMELLLTEMHGGTAQYATFAHDYKRYVGAQIGIYSTNGVRVGEVSHTKNLEYIYVVAKPDVSLSGLDRIGHVDISGDSDDARFAATLF